ncbi:hypothetical protein M433DRAFT_262154 [Acidomyces richmondensis BFW]|nr:MAG: hypothetical protein FE78DRAFT_410612 [Acidomyces sp. 'richmondensis']KYG45333.1 hypothetical protein M433DRAFT_262154 [Acidomyces richmondensis BFW]
MLRISRTTSDGAENVCCRVNPTGEFRSARDIVRKRSFRHACRFSFKACSTATTLRPVANVFTGFGTSVSELTVRRPPIPGRPICNIGRGRHVRTWAGKSRRESPDGFPRHVDRRLCVNGPHGTFELVGTVKERDEFSSSRCLGTRSMLLLAWSIENSAQICTTRVWRHSLHVRSRGSCSVIEHDHLLPKPDSPIPLVSGEAK